jgi:hypothetical protein
VVSADGQHLHAFGRGLDNRIWRAYSADGGNSWSLAWAPIGEGTFLSAPAAAISADGQQLHVFGQGSDNHIWHAHSTDGGNTWVLAWAPIGVGTFISAPAAALSADGRELHVIGEGNDNRVWRAYSPDGGGTFTLAWAPIDALPTPGCASSATLSDVFGSGGMVGCGGAVSFANEAQLCAPHYHVCTSAEWNSNRSVTAPSNDYWTADNLGYSGSGSYSCQATTRGGSSCGATPMRVCTLDGSGHDSFGNVCNWIGCGLNSTRDQYFGGCAGDPTAGTLCCR